MTTARPPALSRAKVLAASVLVAATVATGAFTVQLATTAATSDAGGSSSSSSSDDGGFFGFGSAQPVESSQNNPDTTTRAS